MEAKNKTIQANNDRILEAREERATIIQTYLKEFNAVVSVKANIPGNDKHQKEAFLLVRYFANHFKKHHPKLANVVNSPEGPGVLFCFENDIPEGLKSEACDLEEEDPWGRLIDIDVYGKDGILSRKEPRRCLLCDQIAFDCIRNQRHSESDVLDRIRSMILQILPIIFNDLIKKSIQDELRLEPKFGLVTPSSKGAHPDMDVHLMQAAAQAITPYLVTMALCGWEESTAEELFSQCRKLGLEAERAMLEATQGVNAYRGLIFNLGVVSAAAGRLLGSSGHLFELFEIIKQMTKGITKELGTGEETFGKKAYRKYRLKGARGEAEKGYPGVQEALRILKSNTRIDRLKTLMFLIGHIEDTTLLKRAGSMEKYLEIQSMFARWTDMSDAALASLNQDCIEKGLSFGGSADLLVVICFCFRLKEQFYFPL
ncbi:MAG: triphosphoribosyl-dephospho-CoA synthase [Candidatus Izemoplasmatales bacterium]|nr:triphosphoribosyl-dephospho-CoA synthase [Candidatus Izemoplasmatales bacterium]